VVLITAGVDIQDDRIELEVVGWGRNEETWSLDYKTIYGDPSARGVWDELDQALSAKYMHERGVALPIRSTCVDSGGHHTSAVYTYCRLRENKRIFAIKGIGGEGKPLVGRPTKNNIGKVRLFPIGVDTAKELIYSRLKIADAGPGYCHFRDTYDDEYFKQLTAEQLVTRFNKGYRKREWKKIRPRNEALDCRVYALAAYTLLNVRINTVADRLAKAEPAQEEKVAPKAQRRATPKKQNFATSWS
jgi:phage terminase large subunit GpA-like protein